jgi:hypothetical protein
MMTQTCKTNQVKLDDGKKDRLFCSVLNLGHDLCYQLFVADIFVRFGNIMFLRLIGISMGTKSAALIADLLYRVSDSQG